MIGSPEKIAVVTEVDETPNNFTTDNNYLYKTECDVQNDTSQLTKQVGEFKWTINQQTLLLGCFYYGYSIMNIPGALLAKRFGIRLVLGLTGILSSALTMLMPILAYQSFYLLVIARATVGLLHGVTFPAVVTAWGIWAPPLERSRLMSITFAGGAIGVCLTFPAAGWIVSSINWESVFYITGAIGVIWSIAWLIIIHDTPAKHPRISSQERKYIESSIGIKQSAAKHAVPWKHIFTSPPVLCCFAAHLGDNWAVHSLTALGPMYLERVLEFNTKSAGILSSLPFLLCVVITVLWGMTADFILSSRFLSILTVRKISSSLPLALSSITLIAVAYVGCDALLVVILLAVCVGVLGMTASGHYTSFLEVAPIYGGVTFSISNTFNSGVGFAAPQIAGLLLIDNSLASWRNVFWLAASITLFGSIMYAIFASSQVQSWAQENDIREETENNLMVKKVDTD